MQKKTPKTPQNINNGMEIVFTPINMDFHPFTYIKMFTLHTHKTITFSRLNFMFFAYNTTG